VIFVFGFVLKIVWKGVFDYRKKMYVNQQAAPSTNVQNTDARSVQLQSLDQISPVEVNPAPTGIEFSTKSDKI
jgi:hypothetical protein